MKIIKYLVLSIAIFYLVISHFETAFYWAGNQRIYPDSFRFGDLYRISFLSRFKEQAINCTQNEKMPIKNKIHLYIIGDSFGEESKIDTSKFDAEKYTFIHWDIPKKIDFDTSAKNILIMESVERSAKLHFVRPSNEILIENNSDKVDQRGSESIIDKLKSLVNSFSKNTNNTEERISYTMLNYDFILFFRELKADFDLRFFDRKSPNYCLSKDKNEIFYFDEANPESANSAFYTVNDSEIENFVNIINKNKEIYKKMGFDHVYLSIIPNKVSLLAADLGSYNHVLERIQSHSKLNLKVIDILPSFKKNPSSLFLKSDTHWNCTGSAIWQDFINLEIGKNKK
jgi:hypothetical protein